MVFTSSASPQSFSLTPELWLVAGYLVAPFALALLSLGGSRRAATGVRKLILAGLAAAFPAVAILIAAFLGSAQGWFTLVIAGSFAVVVLLVPSGRCFDGARALVRGDVSRALHLTRLTPYVIGIPAAIAAGLSAPLALTAFSPATCASRRSSRWSSLPDTRCRRSSQLCSPYPRVAGWQRHERRVAVACAHRQRRVARKTAVAVREVAAYEHRPSAGHDAGMRARRAQARRDLLGVQSSPWAPAALLVSKTRAREPRIAEPRALTPSNRTRAAAHRTLRRTLVEAGR